MQIAITNRGIELNETDGEYAQRRMGFALGRFSDLVSRINVTLGDANGPRGGVDKFCRIAVNLRHSEPVAVTAEGATVREVIDLAAERAKRSVSRRLDRMRQRRNGNGAKWPHEVQE